MIYYWNFVMIHESIFTKRVRYNIKDVVRDIGGINASILYFTATFFSIYNYKRHESIVYQVYLKGKGISTQSKRFKQVENGNSRCLSLQLYVYDWYKFIRDFCKDPKLDPKKKDP